MKYQKIGNGSELRNPIAYHLIVVIDVRGRLSASMYAFLGTDT